MPPAARKSAARSLEESQCVFLSGEDDFAVDRRARQILETWQQQFPDAEVEIIEGRVGSVSEAVSALRQFTEAIQTFPFLAPQKIVFFKKCTFLGDDRTSSGRDVTALTAGLPEELKRLEGTPIRVLWTAGKVDKRKTFYKSIGSAALTESFDGWNTRSRTWRDDARQFIRSEFERNKKSISPKTIDFLLEYAGSNPRQMAQEIEKICLYAGEEVSTVDIPLIRQIAVRNRDAEAFALAEALGSRDLQSILQLLDRELASLSTDKSRSLIAILYSLISKVRHMLMVEALLEKKLIRKGMAYGAFKTAIESLPEDVAPGDGKFSVRSAPVFGLFTSYQQSGNYTTTELVQVLEILLECNLQMVTSAVDPHFVLQNGLIRAVNQT
jgi:DNA polymerase-3 subunit delta